MKRLFSVLIVIAMLFTAGCQANSIVDIKVDDEGQLIFYMNDGSNINAGSVKGAAGRDGRDGVDGADGADGKDGADGIGVAKVSINDSGQLMIRLTDGTLINAGEVKGSDGADGKDGADGRDGADGKDGRDFTLPSGQEEAPDGETAAAFMMPRPEPFEYSGENRSHITKYTGADTSVTIPDGVETIGRGAFKGNTSITSVSLPDSVTFIDEDAFSGCTSLCNAVLPNGIIEIGRSAFEGSGLTGTVTVSDGMTIGSSAFAGTNIADVVINVPSGGSVDIGSNAFADCGSLGSLWLISEGDNLISFSEDGIFTGCGDINVFHPDSFILNIMYPSQLTADMLGLNGSIAFDTINDQNMPPA